MKKNRKGIVPKFALLVIALIFLFASGPVFAQGGAATQGQVALNLAKLLNLNLCPGAVAAGTLLNPNLCPGATAADAIAALTALGITPAGGWSANAPANSNFMATLYTSVQSAVTAGTVPGASLGTLGNASAVVAAAGTGAGLSGDMVVDAVTGAGGNQSQATTGANAGSSGVFGFSPASGGPSFAGGPAYSGAGGAGGPGAGGPGGGGGGGGVNPSPNK
jgi:hypothetical protein